jgi:hypothetical protein
MISNRQYVERRNKLLPQAKEYADNIVGAKPEDNETRDTWATRWSKAFSRRVDLLAKQFLLEDSISDLEKDIAGKKAALRGKKDELAATMEALTTKEAG